MSDYEEEFEEEVGSDEEVEEEEEEEEVEEVEEEEVEEEEAVEEETAPEEEPEPEPEPEVEDDVMEKEEEEARQEVTSQPRLSVPRISAPRLPEGELVDLDDITRKRREKDLVELQSLIAKHFEQRQKDEDELMLLQDRIEQRKAARVEQTQIRQAKEKKRMEQEREERKKEEEEARKKAAIANMSLHYGGYLARAEKNKPNKRQTDRDVKKKFLAENKKALNIDHLGMDRLMEKAKELWADLYGFEEEKYDHEQRIARQKYDSNQLRQRVNEYMGKFNKNKSKVKIAGRGVGAMTSTFK